MFSKLSQTSAQSRLSVVEVILLEIADRSAVEYFRMTIPLETRVVPQVIPQAVILRIVSHGGKSFCSRSGKRLSQPFLPHVRLSHSVMEIGVGGESEWCLAEKPEA